MAFLQEYTMLEELGKGGYATVYKVRHNELGYVRAIRVLNETIVDGKSETYQKFLRECKLLLRLGNGNHPNIVHIYQPRLLDNKALVEMDYVDGQDITHYLSQSNNYVPVEDVIRLAKQISSALAYCHEGIYRFCMDRDIDKLQDDPNDGSKVLIDAETRKRLIDKYKVIHNDIHSGNIIRREDGNFVLLDFGLAINGDEVVRSSRHTNGAPEFKAPEKWDDDSILTEQSDIYGFGVVMYQCLAGQVPFPYDVKLRKHIAEFRLGEAHQKSPVPSIENLRKEFYEKKYEGKTYERDYPQWIEDVIMRCLRKDPSERFRNGQELYDYIVEQSQKNTQTSDNKKLMSQVVRLCSTNNDLKNQLNDSTNSYNQLKQDYDNVQNQILTLNSEIKALRSETGTIKSKGSKRAPVIVSIILTLLIVCGLEVGLFIHYYNEYPWDFEPYFALEEKNKEIDELNAKVKELELQNNNSVAENKRLNRTIDKRDATIKDLQKRLDKKYDKDSLNILKKKIEKQEGVIKYYRDTLVKYLNEEISRK